MSLSEEVGVEVEQGYAVKPGETVILRLRGKPSPEQFFRAGDYLAKASKKTGVFFLLLDESIEVVQP